MPTVFLLLGLLQGQPAGYRNPVLPGDHPDPSIVRAGDEYWATSTTSQWAPIFPLLRSTDLVTWTLEGAVFEEAPAWSGGSYWAPEISEHNGKFFVYYTARKKNGPLCVAVATASQPRGPWTDGGPLVCQEAGSIDAAPVTDENGKRFLVWKEDGNSRKLPTPLWLQQLSDDGTALVGKPIEILRNDAPWEGHLIEGPFILRRDGWFYIFYSAGACCGRSCDYRLGVARSRTLPGPWERNPTNPILAGNDDWRCPGHGSVVTLPDGRTFLLYHAYHPKDFQYAGRQGLLDEVTWRNGWPSINGGHGPSVHAASPLPVKGRADPVSFLDAFVSDRLDPAWQWPWDRAPEYILGNEVLRLRTSGRDPASAADTIVARPAVTGSYTATVRMLRPFNPAALAGLCIYGNAANAIGLSLSGNRAVLWRREKGTQDTLASIDLPGFAPVLLRVVATEGSRFQFSVSTDGRTWQDVGSHTEGGYLPPWDLAVRVALAVGGPAGSEGLFDWVRIE